MPSTSSPDRASNAFHHELPETTDTSLLFLFCKRPVRCIVRLQQPDCHCAQRKDLYPTRAFDNQSRSVNSRPSWRSACGTGAPVRPRSGPGPLQRSRVSLLLRARSSNPGWVECAGIPRRHEHRSRLPFHVTTEFFQPPAQIRQAFGQGSRNLR